MVSTRDGHELFSCTDTRYSTNVTPAINPIDIVLNSALNIVELRDITLARAEHEVGREIVLRLPVAEHNVSDFKTEAVEQEAPADRKSLTISLCKVVRSHPEFSDITIPPVAHFELSILRSGLTFDRGVADYFGRG